MFISEQKLQKIREEYPVGTEIVLEKMLGEPNMPNGLRGTVTSVDDIGQIHMKWENGSSLALNVYEDNFTTNILGYLKRQKGLEIEEKYDFARFPKTRDKIVIDIETTGFSRGDDEILQFSIVDVDTKEVLFDEYFKPECKKSWEKAEAVNGISPKMVADKPSVFTKLDEIQEIIASAKTVVVYNSAFDVDFLEYYGINFSTNVIDDPMCYGAVVYGETKEHYYNDELMYGSYKWQKLGNLASYLGYDGDGWHNSTADCLATIYVYNECRKPEHLREFWDNALWHSDYLEDDRFIPSEMRSDYTIIQGYYDTYKERIITEIQNLRADLINKIIDGSIKSEIDECYNHISEPTKSSKAMSL